MKCKDKTKFESKEIAQQRLKEIQSIKDGKTKPVKVYLCQFCNKYHFTSWSKNKKKFVENKLESIKMTSIINFFAKKNKWDINELI